MTRDFPDVEPQEPTVVETDIELKLVADSIDWEAGDALTLPDGVKMKIINENDAEARTDFFVKFPPGYVEPEHTHQGAHASIVLEGRMLVHGHELTPGDYMYGQKATHGPMEYPDGCTMFASFVGGEIAHREWDN